MDAARNKPAAASLALDYHFGMWAGLRTDLDAARNKHH